MSMADLSCIGSKYEKQLLDGNPNCIPLRKVGLLLLRPVRIHGHDYPNDN